MNLGFVGTGKMGEPMAGRLLGAGFKVIVWNRTAERLGPLVAAGADAAANLSDLAERADIVFTMVTDDAAVEAIYSPENGLLKRNVDTKLFVDMSTILPETVKRVAAAVGVRGGSLVDAPVAGTIQPAREGRLLIFAGGSLADLERLKPIFSILARRVEHLGPLGSGAAMKLVHNALLATQWAVLAEGVSMGSRYGLDLRKMLDIISASPAGFAALPNKMPLLSGEPSEIGFNITNVRKDLRAIMSFAESLDVRTDVVRAAFEKYEDAMRHGFDEEDVASIVRIPER